MNSLDVIRRLIEKNEIDCGIEFDLVGNNCKYCAYKEECSSFADARAYLKTGGWHKWPEEKPNSNDRYLVEVSMKEMEPTIMIDYFAGSGWMGWNNITRWQPLPPLPSDKPEELHGKDGCDG